MSQMRAIVLEELNGPLVVRELPIPEPGAGEVLLRVGACAVDRFDLAIRAGLREQAALPHILGHEIAGEVAEVGAGVDDRAPGDRVASTLYLVCGRCRWCRRGRETICERFGGHIGVDIPGGYAEYVVLPARNLVTLPETIGFPAGSILANAIGTPLHALTARMHLQAGERLLVTGAGGGVGLHAVQLGRMLGASVMAADLGKDKLAAARRHGAEIAIDPTVDDLTEAAREWTGGAGVDGVLELVGVATMPATLASLAKGGRMVVVGSHTGNDWTLDPGLVFRNEWEILGSRNVSVDELATVVDLVASGRIEPVVAGTYPFEEIEALHERVRRGEVIGRDVLVPW
ncbi:MAG: alcohol dehydrogenase catalytic domain-containing protein [Acidimicrobiia bacterium]|nr:alcohol dehydrogenase catalytic domain-containing protein [Acidimicrobiia bacterium]